MILEKTFSIREVAEGIAVALGMAFPDAFWVVGEIQGLDRGKHGKHWYFQLCESQGDGDVYRLGATLWNRTRDRLFGAKGKLRGLLDPKENLDGIKIRALCRADFYAPYGKISLHVDDIDPAYTLGDLEAKRQALIEKLTASGRLFKNKDTHLEEVPLRLGLITSEGSAAYNDFMKELEKSGIGFEIFCCDARMQGEEAPATIRAAFAALKRIKPHALVLIRGGGSRLDLSWFDREDVVNLIIDSPCPVITGIGHEIDITVCEMAAYSGLKTPTAAAVFLIDQVHDYLETVNDAERRIVRAAAERMVTASMKFRELVIGFANQVRWSLSETAGFFQDAPRRLVSGMALRLEQERGFLDRVPGMLTSGRALRRFEDQRIRLSRAGLRLMHGWARTREREESALTFLAERGRLLDPAHTIQRGYALLTDPTGKTIKSVEELEQNDPFVAYLRDGLVKARVRQIEREESHGGKEKRQLEIW
ncbi:MAG: exodeoxyribonuclease VII large subunit [Planctomycetes bacterium]|nr:exodeoxyribonuclease VII large subunit [Planctomycetota bacterium]